MTAAGNAWPAPSVYPAVNSTVHLQVLTDGRWTTVTSARVRDNGRYTLTWTSPRAGAQHVRVYKPGGALPCRVSVGSVLSAVGVTLR